MLPDCISRSFAVPRIDVILGHLAENSANFFFFFNLISLNVIKCILFHFNIIKIIITQCSKAELIFKIFVFIFVILVNVDCYAKRSMKYYSKFH